MINDNDGILIEMYLDGALEGSALADFEARLESETELAKALTEREQLHHFLKNQSQREELERSLPEVSEKFFPKEAKIRSMVQRNAFKIIALAAAVALLVFVWQPWVQPSLYDQYAQHKTLALAERGEDSVDPTAIEKAFAANRYEEAIPLLKDYLTAYPNSIEALLYLGICYLETGDYPRADSYFLAIAGGESSFKHAALWYRALTRVKQNDLENAKAFLRLIPGDSEYYEKAQSLLEKI